MMISKLFNIKKENRLCWWNSTCALWLPTSLWPSHHASSPLKGSACVRTQLLLWVSSQETLEPSERPLKALLSEVWIHILTPWELQSYFTQHSGPAHHICGSQLDTSEGWAQVHHLLSLLCKQQPEKKKPTVLIGQHLHVSPKKVRALVSQSCSALCDPMDYNPADSSVHGILQARILEWVPIPFPKGSSWSRDQTWVFRIAGGFLSSEPPGTPRNFPKPVFCTVTAAQPSRLSFSNSHSPKLHTSA